MLVSGVYTLDLDVGLVVCGDGTQYSQGFGASVVMSVDSPFLAFTQGGERIGTGDVDAEGVFHANVTVTDDTAEYFITLDGQAGPGQITGVAQAMVMPVIGPRCTLNTTFTAAPGGNA